MIYVSCGFCLRGSVAPFSFLLFTEENYGNLVSGHDGSRWSLGLWAFTNLSFYLQYSEKEDKYEDEIKVLSDKLKEVGLLTFANLI